MQIRKTTHSTARMIKTAGMPHLRDKSEETERESEEQLSSEIKQDSLLHRLLHIIIVIVIIIITMIMIIIIVISSSSSSPTLDHSPS